MKFFLIFLVVSFLFLDKSSRESSNNLYPSKNLQYSEEKSTLLSLSEIIDSEEDRYSKIHVYLLGHLSTIVPSLHFGYILDFSQNSIVKYYTFSSARAPPYPT
jgi:hypothetical protein